MRQFFSYLALQWKRCGKAFVRLLCILGVIAALLSAVLLPVERKLSKKESLGLLKVAVAIPEDELLSKYVVQYISAMDSVKSICEFAYVSEDEAAAGFRSGEFQAAVVLPENFYHDVQVGLNPPALIYFPENPGLVGSLFRELLMTGVSYLQVAEAGVYATLDISFSYETKLDAAAIGEKLALSYAGDILAREKLFTAETVSAFGELSLSSYYFLAGMLFLFMMSGVFFGFLYGRNARAVEDRLRVNGMNAALCMVARLFVMIPVIYITGIIIYSVCILLSTRFGLDAVPFAGVFFPYMLLLASTLAIYFEIVYRIAGSGKAGAFVLVLLNLIGAACSGLFLPEVYLAGWTRAIGAVLPARYWMMLLCRGIFGFSGASGVFGFFGG